MPIDFIDACTNSNPCTEAILNGAPICYNSSMNLPDKSKSDSILQITPEVIPLLFRHLDMKRFASRIFDAAAAKGRDILKSSETVALLNAHYQLHAPKIPFNTIPKKLMEQAKRFYETDLPAPERIEPLRRLISEEPSFRRLQGICAIVGPYLAHLEKPLVSLAQSTRWFSDTLAALLTVPMSPRDKNWPYFTRQKALAIAQQLILFLAFARRPDLTIIDNSVKDALDHLKPTCPRLGMTDNELLEALFTEDAPGRYLYNPRYLKMLHGVSSFSHYLWQSLWEYKDRNLLYEILNSFESVIPSDIFPIHLDSYLTSIDSPAKALVNLDRTLDALIEPIASELHLFVKESILEDKELLTLLGIYDQIQSERNALPAGKGVSEFSATEIHEKLFIVPGKSVKAARKQYEFTSAESWKIANAFFRSLKAGDDHSPGNYPVAFTTADFNRTKGDMRAFVLDFIERMPAAVKSRNRHFESYARFRIELL